MALRTTYGTLLLLALLAACSETPVAPVAEKPKPAEQPGGEAPEVIAARRKEAAKNIDGYWISDKFLTKIARTKSIYASRKYPTAFFGLVLEKENLLGTTPQLNAFTEHEGGYGGALAFDGHFFVNDPAAKDELSRRGPLQLKAVSARKLEMYFPQQQKTDTYRKVTDEQTEFRRLLLEGTYRTPDNKGRFTFDRAGKVTGFKGKVYCEVVYDFGEGINYDALILFPTPEGGTWTDDMFRYAWSQDTLKLWPIDVDWEQLNHRVADDPLILLKEAGKKP